MRLPLYQIDVFADAVFGGNPAAVCPLDAWLPEATMQAIAAENNLSETAFFVPEGDGYRLRWFTPTVEVELCGHATLAAGWLVLNRRDPAAEAVRFETRSGPLAVTREDGLTMLDLPADPCAPAEAPADLARGLGTAPSETLRGRNWLAVFESEAAVRALAPDFRALAGLHPFGVIVTAPGESCDFVSRFFAPSFGIDEDPVTGSAHAALAPYWAARLGKARLDARQVSRRGGRLVCTDKGARVAVGGRAALYLEGTIEV